MKKVKAFSILELIIVLAVIGLLMASVTQGTKLLKQAKIQKTIAQISLIKTIPLDELNLDTSNEEFWEYLVKEKKLSPSDTKPAIGGVFLFKNQQLILAKNKKEEGCLSRVMAIQLENQISNSYKKLDQNHPTHPNENQDNDERYILIVDLE